MGGNINLVTASSAQEPNEFVYGHTGEFTSEILDDGWIGKIPAGTPMGRFSANRKLRPCGISTIHGIHAGVVNWVVHESMNFQAMDRIDVFSAVGVAGSVALVASGAGDRIDLSSMENDGLAHIVDIESPTLGVLGTRSVVVTAGGDQMDMTGVVADGLAHAIVIVNPSAAGIAEISQTIAAGVKTTTVRLSNSAVPAIDMTLQELCDFINAHDCGFKASVHAGSNPANMCIAVAGPNALAGGVAGPVNGNIHGASTIVPATGIETTVITLGLNAAKTAIVSTVNDVIAQINESSKMVKAALHAGDTGTNVAIATAATPLAGAVAVGGALASNIAVVSVDDTIRTITTATALTAVDGDIVMIHPDGSQIPVGFLRDTANTYSHVSDSTGLMVYVDRDVTLMVSGVVIESMLAVGGFNDTIKAALSKFTYV